MPEFLKQYFESLNDAQADEAWSWFDGGDPRDAVEVICKSHPAIMKRTEEYEKTSLTGFVSE